MHPGTWSDKTPDKLALGVAGGGPALTYAQLDRRAIQLARFFQRAGLSMGDHIAVLLENRLEYLEVCWAAQRSGLYYTPINARLSADEATYILRDCGARVLVTSTEM